MFNWAAIIKQINQMEKKEEFKIKMYKIKMRWRIPERAVWNIFSSMANNVWIGRFWLQAIDAKGGGRKKVTEEIWNLRQLQPNDDKRFLFKFEKWREENILTRTDHLICIEHVAQSYRALLELPFGI